MKNKFLKTISLLIAILTLTLTFSACTPDTPEIVDDSKGSINAVALDKFVIVHENVETAAKRAQTLKETIRLTTGYDLTVVADGEGVTEAEYEIILGKVDREITKKFFENDYKNYNKYQVLVSGKKLAVLASNDYTLGLALKALTNNFFTEGADAPRITDTSSFDGDIYDHKSIAINRRISETDIRIASNNIYFHQKNTKSEIDDYEYRKPYLLQNFVLFDADVLMLQECGYDKALSPTKNTWHDVIDHELEAIGYTYVPANPENKLLVNYTPIWYNADKLELIECKFTMYKSVNEMPDGPLSHSKSYTMAVFKDKNTGEQFACISTHFTYASDPTRAGILRSQDATEAVAEVKSLREKYGENFPIILMGDLNCSTKNNPYKILDEVLDNVLNTEGIVRKNALYGTTHDLGSLPKVNDLVIDHTLVSGSGYKAVQYHHVVNDWSSHSTDHIPLIVDIDLTVD